MPYRNIPVIQVTIRSPRGILLMVPLFPFVFAIFAVSIVFLIWPEALEHSPIGFEARGYVHHLWHGALAAGSLAALWGMFSPEPHRIPMEAMGLMVLTGCFAMNLAALVEDLVWGHTSPPLGSGLDLILRIGLIAAFLIRIYILVFKPTVVIPRTVPNGD